MLLNLFYLQNLHIEFMLNLIIRCFYQENSQICSMDKRQCSHLFITMLNTLRLSTLPLLKLLVLASCWFILTSTANVAISSNLATFDNTVLRVPVVNSINQIGKYEHVQFKLAEDGRWDLISFTEPKQATVEAININILESFPVQIHVAVTGYFPNGCFGLGETYVVKQDNRFNVVINMTELQTLVACTQALVAFEITVPLDVNNLNAGIYQVDVNGIVGSFELSVDNF